jgi:hypothetical protein
MGCINTNPKKSPQLNLSNQEIEIVNAYKIKCLEPKNSKTAVSEILRTHDSLVDVHSIEILGLHPFSPRD